MRVSTFMSIPVHVLERDVGLLQQRQTTNKAGVYRGKNPDSSGEMSGNFCGVKASGQETLLLFKRGTQNIPQCEQEWCNVQYCNLWCHDNPHLRLRVTWECTGVVIFQTTTLLQAGCSWVFVFRAQECESSSRHDDADTCLGCGEVCINLGCGGKIWPVTCK